MTLLGRTYRSKEFITTVSLMGRIPRSACFGGNRTRHFQPPSGSEVFPLAVSGSSITSAMEGPNRQRVVRPVSSARGSGAFGLKLRRTLFRHRLGYGLGSRHLAAQMTEAITITDEGTGDPLRYLDRMERKTQLKIWMQGKGKLSIALLQTDLSSRLMATRITSPAHRQSGDPLSPNSSWE